MPRKMSRGCSHRGRAARRRSTYRRGRRGQFAQRTWQGRRADRVPRGVLKTYTYDFTLTPQILAPNPTSAGAFLLTGGSYPLRSDDITGFSGSNSSTFLVFANLSDVSGGCAHRLQDAANFTSFTALYDAYRINSVTVIMEYMSGQGYPGSNGPTPTIYYYADPDDDGPPTSLTSMSGKQGVFQWQPTSSQSMKAFTFRPRIAVNVATSDTQNVTGMIAPPSQWIDCVRPTVQHNAFKFFITDMLALANPSSVNGWRFTFKYSISFRGARSCA